MKTRWTEKQASEQLAAWRASGQSIDAFAHEHRLPAHRLRYWEKRLAEQAVVTSVKKKPLSLVPVRVTQVVDAPIELVLSSGCIMRVHRGYDEETLLRLVALFGRR